MPDNISTQLLEDSNEHVIDLMRVAASVRKDVLSLLDELESDLAAKIEKVVSKNGLTPQRLISLLKQTRDTIQSAYVRVNESSEADLVKVARAASQNVVASINEAIRVPIVSHNFTLEQLTDLVSHTYIGGAFASEWWEKQGEALTGRFAIQMRLGLLQGESIPDLVRRVRGTKTANFTDGVMNIPRNQAEALVRTSVLASGNSARLATFIQNKDLIDSVQWCSVLDSRTTIRCIALDGLTWELPASGDQNDYGGFTPEGHNKDFSPPPIHWNCRSTIISVLKKFSQLKDNGKPIVDTFQQRLMEQGFSADEAAQIEKDTRASADGQVATDKGFKGWLESKGAQYQDDLLGKTAGQLFRDGKLTLQDLTDQSSRPLSAQALLDKVAKRGYIVKP